MRADRLLQIMLLLESRGGFTTRELAEKLEVSERTIHRDMEALSMAGVPVFAERGAKGGWKLTEGYRIDWTSLRKSELLSILASKPQRHLIDLGLGDAYEAAVQKVLVSLSPSLRRDAEYMRQRVYVDSAGWYPTREELPWLSTIQEAVWEDCKLRMQYASNRDSEAKERLVSPLGLVLKGSLWYLIAARDDHELRSYRVSRIQSAALINEPVIRPENFDLALYWHKSVERFRSELPQYVVRAQIHLSILSRLEQTRFVRVQTGHAISTEQDWVQADLAFHTMESACEILLGFGRNVLVLEPRELRNSLQETANHIVNMYHST
ncbi:hypothetical protein A8709_28955 [Paenibacillus pectinilyticus]|uniref:HTH deoR-type domain-containing protein n=1 Tax=Paenibacillus pectinilyticus TaxID=512399 RepID=A0A1C0ZUW1_9BACL|nr:YafY family protein [Paenibacillus pectinilyticus]OCT11896.1 hypothetical protein A8709_28955 [Paenibacillus pectinilyticus]